VAIVGSFEHQPKLHHHAPIGANRTMGVRRMRLCSARAAQNYPAQRVFKIAVGAQIGVGGDAAAAKFPL
jgi:hypothetical protein